MSEPAVSTRLKVALADRYRLDRELGAGGMATVYLAHDIKHERDVAIKVLHPDLGAALGADRFLSEIKTTAKLQHPHILPLLDSGAADGLLYYVMPLVTGETLRARLDRERQLPIADALRIAREVGSALDYAHRHNVIHRDIKPENILLHDGSAIVADFGIALAVQSAGGARMTQTGLSLGTPQYMSPEQAMGERAIDARSDIYALGAVTYEMLAGEPPFSGPNVQAIVAKVLSERPTPLQTVRDTVPAAAEQAVLAALAKLPADRPPSAAAFASMLSESTATSGTMLASSAPDRRAIRRWQAIAAIAAATSVAAIATASVVAVRKPVISASVVRFTLPAPALNVNRGIPPAISADGRLIAFADRAGTARGIHVRWIDRQDVVVLPGTENAGVLAFAPNVASIAFVSGDNSSTINTISSDGRSTSRIATSNGANGIAWGTDGYVYFVEAAAVRRVLATGGTPEDVVTVPKESFKTNSAGSFRSLVLLDDGHTLLTSTGGVGVADGNIVLVDIPSKSMHVLGRGLTPLAVHDAWLLFTKIDGSVAAQRLDVAKRQLSGAAVTVLDGVYQADLVPFIAVGQNGSLIYQPVTSAASRLSWVSRAGVETELDSLLVRPFSGIALSPAGDRIAVSIVESPVNETVWMYDLSRRTLAPMTKQGERSYRPQWAPRGDRVLFVREQNGDGARRIFSVAADGSGTLRLEVARARHVQEISWPNADAPFAFREGYSDGSTLRDIFSMKSGDSVAHAVVATAADEASPVVSPDGHWLGYTSDVSGKVEVWLTPFPEGGARLQVSSNGGVSPVWSHDGRELYYRDSQGKLIATVITSGSPNPIGASNRLFDASKYVFDPVARSFDVSRDGRFLFVKPPVLPSMNVVLNWWTETAALLAAAKK